MGRGRPGPEWQEGKKTAWVCHGTCGLDSQDGNLLEYIKGDSYIELDLTDKTKMQSQLLPLFACSKSQESLPGRRMGELETLTLPREHQVREGP